MTDLNPNMNSATNVPRQPVLAVLDRSLEKFRLMNKLARIALGLPTLASCLGLCVVCYYLATRTHFFVTDAVGDSREMQDFQVSRAFWEDWLVYIPFYIPTAIVGLLALATGYGAFVLLFNPFRLLGRRNINPE